MPYVGISPEDVSKTITKNTDMVFIDGGHSDATIYKDINAVVPYISKQSWLLLHDTHHFNDINTIIEKLNTNLIIDDSCKYPNGYNLGYCLLDKTKLNWTIN